MSASMLIATALGPDYDTPDTDGNAQLVNDRGLILERMSQKGFAEKTLETIMTETDMSYSYEIFSDDELELLDEDHDNDEGIEDTRLALAAKLLAAAIDTVFPAMEPAPPTAQPSPANRAGFSVHPQRAYDISNEVTWESIPYSSGPRTRLMSGGMSYGDLPTDAVAPLVVIAESELFNEPFPRP